MNANLHRRIEALEKRLSPEKTKIRVVYTLVDELGVERIVGDAFPELDEFGNERIVAEGSRLPDHDMHVRFVTASNDQQHAL